MVQLVLFRESGVLNINHAYHILFDIPTSLVLSITEHSFWNTKFHFEKNEIVTLAGTQVDIHKTLCHTLQITNKVTLWPAVVQASLVWI